MPTEVITADLNKLFSYAEKFSIYCHIQFELHKKLTNLELMAIMNSACEKCGCFTIRTRVTSKDGWMDFVFRDSSVVRIQASKPYNLEVFNSFQYQKQGVI